MVRVLQCHHFAGQDVFNTDHEPLTLYTSGHWLFVASVQCCIHVHDLNQQGCPCIAHMPTIATPKQILHCPKGNYIAAIEEKSTRHSTSAVVSVRFYLQWEKASSNTPMKINFAGNIKSSSPDGLEIIELPMLSHDPSYVACCTATGNLAIAVHKLVKIYEVVEHQDKNGSVYRDVEPVLDIRFSMVLKQVAISEEFLAVLSLSELHVVRLHDRDIETTRNEENSYTSSNGTYPSVDELEPSLQLKDEPSGEIHRDPDYVDWDCLENDNPTQYNSQGQLSTILVQSKKVLDSQNSNADVEILGPTGHEVIGHPITIWYDGCVMQESNVTTHLYRRFSLRDDQDYLHSLQFVTLYKKADCGNSQVTTSTNGVLQSSSRSDLIGLCLFCSSTGIGYLYNVLNTTELLATFPYTAQTSQVAATNGLIYSISKTGLEIYTSRGYVKAIHNMDTFDDVTQTCPPPTLDTCLVGVQPFMVIQCLSVSADHLVLMSKVTSSRTSSVNSSIYALENSKPDELVKEMVAYGSRHHQSSPPAYLQLLQEAYLCLRGYMLEQEANSQIKALYSDVCAMLGDYYARSDLDDNQRLTLPYYLMTGYSPQEIISRLGAKQSVRHGSVSPPGVTQFCRGVIHYFHYILFNKQSVLFNTELDSTCCDKILDIYETLKPQAVPDIVLKSALTGYSYDKAMSALQKIGKTHSPSRTLALTLVYLKDCNFASAESTLFVMQEKDIINVCLENYHLLHTDLGQLTALSQLVKKHKPHIFAAIWNNVYNHQLMDLDMIINILQSGNAGQEVHRNYHLALFLENLLTNSQEREDIQRKHEITELLCSIYMQRILDPEEKLPRSMTAQNTSFLVRHSWLNELPPFNGEVPGNKCIHMKDTLYSSRGSSLPKLMTHNIPTRSDGEVACCCWSCNHDLIKLQSILSAKLVSPEFVRKLLSVVTTKDIRGCESLEILCTALLSIEEATDLIVDKHSKVLVKFVSETLSTDKLSQWSHLINYMSSVLRDVDTKQQDEATRALVTSFKDVLLYMSTSLSPADFLTLLPPDVSLSFVLPCIKKSVRKHLALKLKSEMKLSD